MKQTFLHIVSRFKYLIALVVFVIFIGFVGEHSIINRIHQKREISELQNKISSERDCFVSDSMQCIAIDKDPEAVREIAREYYYMKNSGEDVFMIKDEKGEEDE